MIVVSSTNMAAFDGIVASVPELATAEPVSVSLLSGGMTNTSYVVTTKSAQVVVLIGCENRSILGIDRATEEEAVRLAAGAGIAPEVLFMSQPDGHLVTRYVPEASTPTIEQFTAPDMIPRVGTLLKAVHSLGSVSGRFDPFADIDRWTNLVEARLTKVPSRLARLLEQVERTRQTRTPTPEAALVLCHNDPYRLNFLVDDGLWLIDWEYAGMGDAMYDLAGIAYMLDGDGRDSLLAAHYGSVAPWMRESIEELVPVFVCWNAMWCLVESETGGQGIAYNGLVEGYLDWLPG